MAPVGKKMMFSIYDDTPEINGFSRDLLVSYLTSKEKEEDDNKIELGLGLSLNGQFVVDPRSKTLSRSSSIPEFLNSENYLVPEPQLSLVRTSSLPIKIKTEEELMKLKEIHKIKRLIAKRKWLKKLKRGKISRDRVLIEQSLARQGSTCSSEITESGSPPQLAGELKNRKEEEDQENKRIMKKVFLEMPQVYVLGDGPNGEKRDGFLYRFNKVDEIRIVCICHGRFHSPAEFVKHAGAKDVVYPLKRILVSPSPFM